MFDPKRKGVETSKCLLECLEDDLDQEEAKDSLKCKGVMILLSSISMKGEDVVPYYYTRQSIENIFGFFKADLKVLPLRKHNEGTLRGHLFLIFLTLIFFLECKKAIGVHYTVEEMLSIMRTLKCKVFEREVLVQELNKMQNKICKRLKIIVPKKTGI